MHLPGGMSRMTSNRLVQSASHSGMGTMPASINPSSSLRNDGHQKVSNCLADMKRSRAQAEIVERGEIGHLLDSLEGSGHPRQVLLQIEAGRIEQELVVFLRLHVLAVEVLKRLVIPHAVTGPLQLLESARLERAAAGAGENHRAGSVG